MKPPVKIHFSISLGKTLKKLQLFQRKVIWSLKYKKFIIFFLFSSQKLYLCFQGKGISNKSVERGRSSSWLSLLGWWLHDPDWSGWYSVSFSRDPGSVIKLFINYILCEKFHPGKVRSLFCTAGILPCRNEIFPCNRFSPTKRGENVI